MIIINSGEDMDMGSKRFTLALSDVIRPHLKEFLNADELEDFELDLYQVMIHIGYWTQEQFMRLFRLIEGLSMGNLEWEREILIEIMKKDPRYSEEPTK